jgi:hypothetical protein
MRYAVMICALLLAVCVPAAAGEITLNDGTTLKGEVTMDEANCDILLRTAASDTAIRVPMHIVSTVNGSAFSVDSHRLFARRFADTDRDDMSALTALADWCMENKLDLELSAVIGEIAKFDPMSRRIRVQLLREQSKGKWPLPDLVSPNRCARMAGMWFRPEELVELGYANLDGRWQHLLDADKGAVDAFLGSKGLQIPTGSTQAEAKLYRTCLKLREQLISGAVYGLTMPDDLRREYGAVEDALAKCRPWQIRIDVLARIETILKEGLARTDGQKIAEALKVVSDERIAAEAALKEAFSAPVIGGGDHGTVINRGNPYDTAWTQRIMELLQKPPVAVSVGRQGRASKQTAQQPDSYEQTVLNEAYKATNELSARGLNPRRQPLNTGDSGFALERMAQDNDTLALMSVLYLSDKQMVSLFNACVEFNGIRTRAFADNLSIDESAAKRFTRTLKGILTANQMDIFKRYYGTGGMPLANVLDPPRIGQVSGGDTVDSGTPRRLPPYLECMCYEGVLAELTKLDGSKLETGIVKFVDTTYLMIVERRYPELVDELKEDKEYVAQKVADVVDKLKKTKQEFT